MIKKRYSHPFTAAASNHSVFKFIDNSRLISLSECYFINSYRFFLLELSQILKMESTNPLGYLSPDELEVEYRIRDIVSKSKGAELKLVEALQKEVKDPKKLAPRDCHILQEVEEEEASILEAGQELSNLAAQLNVAYDEKLCLITKVRSMHWLSRAQRFLNTHGDNAKVATVGQSMDRICRYMKKTHREQGERRKKKDAEAKANADRLASQIASSDASTSNQGEEQPKPPGTASDGKASVIQEFSLFTSENPIEDIGMMSCLGSLWDEPRDEKKRHQHNASIMGNAVEIANQRSGPSFNLQADYNAWRVPNAQYGSIGDPVYDRELNIHTRRNYVPKWDVSYDGVERSGQDDVYGFIATIEMMAAKERYPINEIGNIIHYFLKGKAKTWLLIHHHYNPNATWEMIKRDLLSKFSMPDTDYETRVQLQSRYQKPNESFDDFLLDVQNLNLRLRNRFTNAELLQFLSEHMSLELREKTLQNRFDNVEMMRHVCQSYENIWRKQGKFQQPRHLQHQGQINRNPPRITYQPGWSQNAYGRPSTPCVAEIGYGEYSLAGNHSDEPHEPSYGMGYDKEVSAGINRLTIEEVSEPQYYPAVSAMANYPNRPQYPQNPMSRNLPADHPNVMYGNQVQSQQNNDQNTPNTIPICWNCKDIGHRYEDCRFDELHRFCRGCGKPGYNKNDCFNCQKRKSQYLNYRPSAAQGNPHSESKSDPIPKTQQDQTTKK